MRKFLYVFVISFFFINCDKNQTLETITTAELKTLLSKKKIQLIDVRTPQEIKEGFIATAIFANYFEDDFAEKAIPKLDRDKPVYLICRSGNRSGKATKMLQKKGYEVYNVLGG
mgnify:CR=1 FL=1